MLTWGQAVMRAQMQFPPHGLTCERDSDNQGRRDRMEKSSNLFIKVGASPWDYTAPMCAFDPVPQPTRRVLIVTHPLTQSSHPGCICGSAKALTAQTESQGNTTRFSDVGDWGPCCPGRG